jgi:hypothetical protein
MTVSVDGEATGPPTADILDRVTVKMSAALGLLLILTIGACSDGGSSSETTLTTPQSALDSAPAETETETSEQPSTTRAPATTASIPKASAGSSTTLGTPQVVATTSTLPNVSPSSSPPGQPSTDSSVPAPSSGEAKLLDRDCTAANADAGHDLLHATVESLGTRYRFIARYSGDTFQHDILVSFDLGASTYLVTAELFEDGNGVGRVTRRGSADDIFLDPPQAITPGLVDLSVRNDQIGAISGTPFVVRVSLTVDGSEVENCQ